MRVDIVTVFPDMVRQAAGASILGRAQASGKIELHVHDLRDYAANRHRSTDDAPFGGGAGMVMLPAPLFACVEAITGGAENVPVIYTAPDGEPFTQSVARELSAEARIIILCGHYEGVDERVRQSLVTREISIGDYVLTGGELPALVILDAVTRLLPDVLGNAASPHEESFGSGEPGAEVLLEYPQYTRPADFRGMVVPEVLQNGHHAKIMHWRRTQSLIRTRERRPDLFAKMLPLSKSDQKLLDAHDAEKSF
ncbi:MAG: tRNA (guanosine(37)-N1)-methyltransferase TrmD [Armatimonadetes bacterium]|nr:tRNA (guanosine(37)-N1)-methyltransferase TrmD [Armatimonadota bacterium]